MELRVDELKRNGRGKRTFCICASSEVEEKGVDEIILLSRCLSSTDTCNPGILLGKGFRGSNWILRSTGKEIGGTWDRQRNKTHSDLSATRNRQSSYSTRLY